jgi:hypothetical protein
MLRAESISLQIKEALVEYFEAIKKQSHSDPQRRPSLRPHFERLDILAGQLPASEDPQLHHYMKQKSYEKALNHLTGNLHKNTEGSCHR